MWRNRIHKTSLQRNALQNRCGREWSTWKFKRIIERTHTQRRTHRNSEVKLWMKRYTEIGPVRDAKIICHHGRHGIKIQNTSTFGDDTNVWVVISRGPNRYVDELQHRESGNLLEKADYECMQDTDQEQPTTQLEMSDDHIPIPERKWNDLISNALSFRYTSESQISKVVSKLVRHENGRDRETDGAIHWKFIFPKLIITFRRDGSHELTDRAWINYIWKGSSKTQRPALSEFLQQLIVHPSHSRSHRRRNDWTWDDGVTSSYPQLETVCVPQRLFI